MTKEITHEIKAFEHAQKQPRDKRYSIWCKCREINCKHESTLGYINDAKTYQEALEIVSQLLYPVAIYFFPNNDNPLPTDDFLNAISQQ